MGCARRALDQMDGGARLKVLFLTDSLSDLDGVGRYAMCLIAALEKEIPDLEVEVLLARKHRPTSKSIPSHWKLSVALPPDYFFHMSPSRFWPNVLIGTWNIWRRARHADLVHAIKDYPHSLTGLLASKMAGVPCIATAHGTYTIQPLLVPRHSRLAAWTYRRFAAMISVSRYTRRRLLALMEKRGLDAERVHVIPNCVDVENYVDEQHSEGQLWADKRFTLSIGELKERKGLHIAIEAWCQSASKHPDLHHFVVGNRSGDDYEKKLHSIVESAGLSDRVHFLGNIDEALKIELLQKAEVFVHTPVTAEDGGFEGFGIVYLEAAASGTPSIGTLDCGAEDAIIDEGTGFLVEQTVAAAADALDKLLGDPDLRKTMGAAGRAHAASQTWDHNATQVARIYLESLC
ncbi:MAG: phosphatidylinositol alpha-1,6-mannosyltransferase [Planctomycetota bacterium]